MDAWKDSRIEVQVISEPVKPQDARGRSTSVEEAPTENFGYGEVDQQPVSNTKSSQECKYKCGMCGEEFSKKIEMHIHRLNHVDAFERGDPSYEEETDSNASQRTKNEQELSFYEAMEILNDGPNLSQNESKNQYSEAGGDLMTNLEELKLKIKGHIPSFTGESPTNQECMNMISRLSEKSQTPLQVLLSLNSKTYRCRPCDMEFNDFRSYLRHREGHPNPKLYYCGVCNKGFTVKGNLQRHEQIHKDIRRYKCSICEKRFSQKTHLSAHMSVHNKKQPYICQLCGAHFKKESSMTQHMLVHNRSEDLPVTEDGRECSNEANRTKHENQVYGLLYGNDVIQKSEREAFCDNQEKVDLTKTCDQEGVKSSNNLEKLADSSVQSSTNLNSRNLDCKYANKLDPSQRGNTIGESSRTNCPSVTNAKHQDDIRSCAKTMNLEQSTAEFCDTNYSGRSVSQGKACSCNESYCVCRPKHKTYKCATCDSVFHDFRLYMIHKKEHPSPRLYSCEICGSSFTIKGNLQRHLQIHRDIRLHECHICNKKFSQKTHLEAHKLVHSKERPHTCSLCGSSFTRMGNLRRHIEKHSSFKHERSQKADNAPEKTEIFKCTECAKTFTRKGNLQRHQKLHLRGLQT